MVTTAALFALTAGLVAIPGLPASAGTPIFAAVSGPVAALNDIVLGVGADETQRNVTWYSSIDVPQSVQFAPTKDLVAGAFPETVAPVSTTGGGLTSSGEFYRDATMAGLAENTAYSYRVGSEVNGWSAISSFTTQSFTGNFEFLFFGDAQLGASGNLTRDGAGWLDTLDVATQSYPDAELLFSAGDQVDSAPNEDQYKLLFAPEQMRTIPFVTTNGNHDVGSKAYEQHFTAPNEDLTSGAASNGNSSGGDYWFMYKDVLFININSNSMDSASHDAFMTKVVAEHGDDAKWKVLAFHHSIYSVAEHTFDADIISRRASMPKTISSLGFDMVLMGHDHSYTRSYLIKDGVVANSKELAGANEVVAEPGEVLYVTANSSSGSKYYDVKDPNAAFASVINQEKVRNYSVLEVTDENITMRTMRSERNGATKPVNSIVDEVVLSRADQTAPVITGAGAVQVPFGSTFNALAGITATDDTDGDVTAGVTVTGTVDTSALGDQMLSYSVSDVAGNNTKISRVVTVVKAALTAGTVTITGTPRVGSTLTAVTAGWTTGTSFEHQWLSNGVPLTGATTGTLAVPVALLGTTISVKATGTLENYTGASVESAATAAVTKPVVAAGTVAVSGTARVASTLTATVKGWDAAASLSYQWLANGAAISTAKAKTFVVPATAAGKKITVRVTATVAGSEPASALSSPTAAIAKAKFVTKTAKITGTVRVGKTVKVSTGSWSPKPTYSYRWYANGKAISGATSSSLKIKSSLKNKKLTVAVTGTRTGYLTVTVTSAKATVKKR